MVKNIKDKSTFLFSVIVLFLIVNCACFAGRLQLVHADSARGRADNGRFVRELLGNVVFRQDSSQMFCDTAIQYVDERCVRFSGHVLIQNPPRELWADEIFYFEESKEQLAQGNARLIDHKRILAADSLHYYEGEERVLAHGRVQLEDTKEQARLRGSKMEYLRQKGYARVVGRPVFTQQDTTQKDSLVISSDYMEMMADGDTIRAVDKVEITKGVIHAVGGLLQYSKKNERIILSREPRAERDADRIRGVEIDLLLIRQKIEAIHIKGEGMVLSRVDTVLSKEKMYDFLSGEEIYVRLNDESIDSVFVKGRATSYYHLFEQKKNKGINKVLGDEIRIKLATGKMQQVEIKSTPAVSSGIFFPREKQDLLTKELENLIQQIMQPAKAIPTTSEGKKRDLLRHFN